MKLLNYLSQLPVYIWFIISLFTIIISDLCSKNFAIKQNMWWFYGIIIIGCVGSTIWAIIMLSMNQLIRTSFIWTVLASLVSISVGLVFRETLTMVQWIGVILALISICLLA